ncbi:MAG: hypothetical protein COT71_03175 [Candidatus Andersenbacteria bacterium CG10_big_fil_rev_8_21_14_0_10_54_11]|uniref:Uncharacterized protein n=1 Tax=Candidatus Andersenbacteria bacterium CG10_big_fil_rev_8_21_14_0_10_54_11 TaxID=1974485 RepID=A0A2M6WYR5_9BACT|nr:MAG: hypothetical protein COT71_03175 [Candidatus Andersenbacteria bacterium CG10_big_fil_rev_8_21_14_0_10_54_11]
MITLYTLNDLLIRLLGAVVFYEYKAYRVQADVYAGQGIGQRRPDQFAAVAAPVPVDSVCRDRLGSEDDVFYPGLITFLADGQLMFAGRADIQNQFLAGGNVFIFRLGALVTFLGTLLLPFVLLALGCLVLFTKEEETKAGFGVGELSDHRFQFGDAPILLFQLVLLPGYGVFQLLDAHSGLAVQGFEVTPLNHAFIDDVLGNLAIRFV